MSKIKVMIVDDHLVVREGLKQLLEVDDRIEVVGEASSGLECLKILEKKSPDVLFMDVRMPGISGIETTRLVCQKYPAMKVIIMTIYEDDQYVLEAVKAGAKAYILKKVQREELLKIIQHVIENRAFLDPMVTAPILNHLKQKTEGDGRGRASLLTQRELEVLKGMVAGDRDLEIARSLCISGHTVRSHIKNLYRKLGVSSRAKAVARAFHEKLIDPAG